MNAYYIAFHIVKVFSTLFKWQCIFQIAIQCGAAKQRPQSIALINIRVTTLFLVQNSNGNAILSVDRQEIGRASCRERV